MQIKFTKEHYRLQSITREITKRSQFLLATQGNDEDEELTGNEENMQIETSMIQNYSKF